eukprot:gene57761-77093_t
MSGTPGPNNVMVLASGVNYGYRRTLPHIFGINIGFSLMLGIMALGLGAAFLAEPRLQPSCASRMRAGLGSEDGTQLARDRRSLRRSLGAGGIQQANTFHTPLSPTRHGQPFTLTAHEGARIL